MKKINSIIAVVILVTSCQFNDSELIDREKKAINYKIEYTIGEFQKEMLLNPQKIRPFYYGAEKLRIDLNYLKDSINLPIDNLKLKEIENRIESIEKLLKNKELKLDCMRDSLIRFRLFSWRDNFSNINWNEEIKNEFNWNLLNLEFELIDYWFTRIDQNSFNVNLLEPIIIDSPTKVKIGDIYTAKILMTAFDTTVSPQIMIGEYDYEKQEMKGIEGEDYFYLPIERGAGIYKKKIRKSGMDSIKGIVRMINKNHEFIDFPFKKDFVKKNN